ncbi:toll/interleukin-1 receptor domain-containing protein [Ideonella sp. DXS29W]|uniref:Toll/interleukin-1 receptor domain-containing protein n=1 Tax=Ideonella lacteola TaxID=2984193 RepID=A0ABU9BW46_9BURK
MAQCTAPVRGHSSPAAAAACPACRYKYGRGYSYGGGYSTPSYPSYSSGGSSSSYRGGSGGSSGGSSRPRWSRSGSTVFYTPAQVQSLTPVREAVEKVAAEQPDLRDCFLCHAWADRKGAAKELDDALKAAGVKTWFSELDLGLGVSMMRAIDRGLANSRIGLVLVTPSFIKGLPNQGVADKELSALLAGNRLVPIVHGTTYDELRNESPLLASRTGLDTKEETMASIAEKVAELVKVSA